MSFKTYYKNPYDDDDESVIVVYIDDEATALLA